MKIKLSLLKIKLSYLEIKLSLVEIKLSLVEIKLSLMEIKSHKFLEAEAKDYLCLISGLSMFKFRLHAGSLVTL
jgi:hypothetical protein